MGAGGEGEGRRVRTYVVWGRQPLALVHRVFCQRWAGEAGGGAAAEGEGG